MKARFPYNHLIIPLCMSRCLHCGYLLVLLERRSKYKCAKCSRLYPQRLIDSNEFREWNKKERLLDKELLNVKKPRKPREKKPSLTKEEKTERNRVWCQKNADAPGFSSG